MIRFSPNHNRAHLINWLEWGPEAFQEASRRDKLVMLYLGAFWCGYCQRMDESTFSDDETIALVNAYFVPLRVENAQRPDIDARYNQNGWPTVAFMTPQGDHLASVNYLPPDEFGNLLGWLYTAYRDRKSDIQDAVLQAREEASRKAGFGGGRGGIREAAVSEIGKNLIDLADTVHGGYGPDHKFPHPEANEFLLDRYETTRESVYLDHVILTLDRMREGEIHDKDEGGYFRYSTKPDWSEPHREKLLVDQAGLLGNCLRAFSMSQRPIYREMAEEIIDYLNTTLSDPSGATFRGCQDYFRPIGDDRGSMAAGRAPKGLVSVVDGWLYTDANAQAICAYLEASTILGRPDCRGRAGRALAFLWNRCRSRKGGMVHCFDGEPKTPGLLMDQVHMGLALLQAYRVTEETSFLARARELADLILGGYHNPDGGFFDIREAGLAHLRFRLTLLSQNGSAAVFFLRLAEAVKEERYREAARWALAAFTGDLAPYGVHAAGYGRALASYVSGAIGRA